MDWYKAKRSGSGTTRNYDGCAVCVVFTGGRSSSDRIKLVLSGPLLSAYRLQFGDRLQAGYNDDGRLMLRRHTDGNKVQGRGFTKPGGSGKRRSGSTNTQPFVAFERSTFPVVYSWAKQFENGTWIEVVDHGTHWESIR